MNLQAIFARLPRPLRRHKALQLLLRVQPRLRVQEIRFNGGARLLADLRDANARTYFFRGHFEPEFFAIAVPFLARGGTFFDIGANFGFCTFGLLHQLRMQPPACHLFEANPHLCDLLRASAQLDFPRVVTVNHACVTDRSGTSALKFVAEDTGRSHVDSDGTASSPNLRLDDYLRDHAIHSVAFAKLDIEGCEPAAFRGAATALCAGVFEAIYFEVSTTALARQAATAAELCAVLTGAGYRIYYCKPSDLVARREVTHELRVGGNSVPVAEFRVDEFPSGCQTDLLALPGSSPLVERLRLSR